MDERVKELDTLLERAALGEHLTPDETVRLQELASAVGDDWRRRPRPKSQRMRAEVPRDLHEVLDWWKNFNDNACRTVEEWRYLMGDQTYDHAKQLFLLVKAQQNLGRKLADVLTSPEELWWFAEHYGHEFALMASKLPGEEGERWKRAAAVLNKNKPIEHEQASQNQNWNAKPGQREFTYSDIAYLAGVSVRQAKRVLTAKYGTATRGSRRTFTRAQVQEAFPRALESR